MRVLQLSQLATVTITHPDKPQLAAAVTAPQHTCPAVGPHTPTSPPPPPPLPPPPPPTPTPTPHRHPVRRTVPAPTSPRLPCCTPGPMPRQQAHSVRDCCLAQPSRLASCWQLSRIWINSMATWGQAQQQCQVRVGGGGGGRLEVVLEGGVSGAACVADVEHHQPGLSEGGAAGGQIAKAGDTIASR
jgi:hypothetical protein